MNLIRPQTAEQMHLVLSTTFDIYSFQFLTSNYCTVMANSAAFNEGPEGDGMSCRYSANRFTITCSENATSLSWRRFCPCTAGLCPSYSVMIMHFI
jgi:hypothetical protein